VNALWKRRPWREPDVGNLHVRFDEGEESGGHWSLGLSFRAFLSTLLVSYRIVTAKDLRVDYGQKSSLALLWAGLLENDNKP